jgi:hypothetical protein
VFVNRASSDAMTENKDSSIDYGDNCWEPTPKLFGRMALKPVPVFQVLEEVLQKP